MRADLTGWETQWHADKEALISSRIHRSVDEHTAVVGYSCRLRDPSVHRNSMRSFQWIGWSETQRTAQKLKALDMNEQLVVD